MIEFIVPGEPQGKARPRVTRKGITYTPEKTQNYEALIKMLAKQAQIETGEFYADGPVSIVIKCYYSIPKSTSAKKSELMKSGEIRPTKKPDADNVLKIVCDALNGICYKDDTQVVRVVVEKWYAEIPRLEVMLGGAV